jgi:hypothetical protein
MMASTRLMESIDRLQRMTEQERRTLGTAAAGVTSASNPLGLRFAAGARVIDLTTGQHGTVTRGARDEATGYERFSVRLADARLVFRTDRELEPDAQNPSSPR